MHRSLLKFGLIAFILVVILVVDVEIYLNSPLQLPAQKVLFTLEPGKSASGLIASLQKRSFIKRPTYLAWWMTFTRQDRLLKAGEYEFTTDITPKALIDKMTRGEIKTYTITVIEGWRLADFFKEINASKKLVQDIDLSCHSCLINKLDLKQTALEGLFFPSTYRYTAQTTVTGLLQRAHTALDKQLTYLWMHRTKNSAIQTPYDALILASLVEKEAHIPKERSLIAGVILNRLAKNMRLQIDATVAYGLNKPPGYALTKQDLKSPSPYNTYLNNGLPPTPIALPSYDALKAAMNPTETDYLYFVAKNDGSHQFSKTLASHNEAVQRYQKNTVLD